MVADRLHVSPAPLSCCQGSAGRSQGCRNGPRDHLILARRCGGWFCRSPGPSWAPRSPSSVPSAGCGACSVHFWESPQALSRISHRRSGTGSRHRRSINGSPRCLRFPVRSARQGEGPACSDLRPALLTDLGGKHQSDDDVESAHKSPEDQVSQIDPHP